MQSEYRNLHVLHIRGNPNGKRIGTNYNGEFRNKATRSTAVALEWCYSPGYH